MFRTKRNRRRLIYGLGSVLIISLTLGLLGVQSTSKDLIQQSQMQLRQKDSTLKQQIKTYKQSKVQTEQQQKQIEDLNRQLQETQKQLQAKLEAKKNAIASAVTTPRASAAPMFGGSHTDWMAQAGIASSDWGYVDYIVSHESGWRISATNGRTWGLCQALPGSKMASAGADWQTNPVTQLRWCNQYAQGKGGWAASYSFWLAHHWW